MIKLNKVQKAEAIQLLTVKLMTALNESNYDRTVSGDVIELLQEVAYDELGGIVLRLIDEDGDLDEEITGEIYCNYIAINKMSSD